MKMFNELQDIKQHDRTADFLFPSLPQKIKGKVSHLSENVVVIDSEVDGDVFQYITHPNNVCIVQLK